MTKTTSQTLLTFFSDAKVRAGHNAHELLDLYNLDMEVQINVAADGGDPVPGKRNAWLDPDDSLSEPWYNVRMPKNANGEPERNDWPLEYDFAKHVEGVGCTGWDFGQRCSRWFGFDFDSIVGHASDHGISDAALEAVKAAAWEIPWLEIRKSTGGKGLHLYVRCTDEGIATANHSEHAALGRAVLEVISSAAGFDFTASVDCCGGNMWVWHRKATLANEGLKLLKAATRRLTMADLPGDWRSHLPVVQRKRATQRIIGLDADAENAFDDLVRARKRVPLGPEHKRVMEALTRQGFSVVYQQDNHLVQTHTAGLAKLMDDPSLEIRGIFKTISAGTDPGKPNCFMFALANGGWKVFRFSPGAKEAETWDHAGHWTCCEYNVRATLSDAVHAVGGFERSDGSYAFGSVPQGLTALKGMGIEATAPAWTEKREMSLKPHKSRRKLIAFIAHEADDDNPRSAQDMRDHRWNCEGVKKQIRWVQIVKLPPALSSDRASEMLDRYDAAIRSLKTPDGQDAGWRVKDDEGDWVVRDRTAAKDALLELAVPATEVGAALAKLQRRNWTMRNMPFQPEFPGGRTWNIGANWHSSPPRKTGQ